MTRIANLEADQVTHVPAVYTVDNTLMNAGGVITIDYPYPTHIKLDVQGLDNGGRVTLVFTGDPKDGEMLNITVQQPSDEFNVGIHDISVSVAGSPGSPGFARQTPNDILTPDPHEETVTHFQLVYNADNHHYIKISEGVTGYGPSSDFQYDYNTRYFDKPQKSWRAMSNMWVPLSGSQWESDDFGKVTNPVFVERSTGPFKEGLVMWASVDFGVNAYLYWMRPGGMTHRTTLGPVTGNAAWTLAVRERISISDDTIFLKLRTNDNTYSLRVTWNLNVFNVDTFAALGESGSPNNNLIYKDIGSDRFYWIGGASAELVRSQDGAGAFAPATVFTASGFMYGMARAPNGRIGVAISAATARFAVSTETRNAFASTWSAEQVVGAAPGAPTGGIAWDRPRARWIILSGDFTVWASTDIEGTSWSQVGDISAFVGGVGPAVYFAGVGNTLVAARNTSPVTGYTIVSYDGGVTWTQLTTDSGASLRSMGIGGIGYMAGRLFAPLYNEQDSAMAMISSVDCNRWGPLDIDK